ncbi:hypothetical protein [Aeromonas jandaei]|uniref:hypothetical protein n=1 Tax=Aeromonas jandaei TaxID=650 RepID=UPI003BA3A269
MRKLCEEIATTQVENRVSAAPAKVASLRARLATSINPKDTTHDNEILTHFDRLFYGETDDLDVFVHRIALLLKHDWERVKWECTPFYIKLFTRFSKKQHEWRQENYREVKLTSTQINDANHVSERTSKTDRFFLQLIDTKPGDITLKFAFDNIRNYGIAVTIMAAGLYLAQHGAQVNHFFGAGVIFGSILVVTGLALYILNICQAIWVLLKLKIPFVPYFVSGMAIFLGTMELLVVLFKQFFDKNQPVILLGLR